MKQIRVRANGVLLLSNFAMTTMKKFWQKWAKKFWRFFIMPIKNRQFMRTPALFQQTFSADPQKIFVISSAFNDVSLISLQYRALKKFLKSPFEFFVVDNSTKDEGSDAIKKFCLEQKINYTRLPRNVGNLRRDAGVGHGLAVNWACRNIVEKHKPWEFGIWDADLFPTKPIDIEEKLRRTNAWGIAIRLRPRLTPWHYPMYLWVGMAFFRLDRFKNHTPNFLPTFGVDTGGRIALDAEIDKAWPDMTEYYSSPFIEVAPGATMRKCGDMVHFEGAGLSSMGLKGAEADKILAQLLAKKKEWVEALLKDQAWEPKPAEKGFWY